MARNYGYAHQNPRFMPRVSGAYSRRAKFTGGNETIKRRQINGRTYYVKVINGREVITGEKRYNNLYGTPSLLKQARKQRVKRLRFGGR